MFGNTKMELRFAKLTEIAVARYKGFDVRNKGLSKGDLERGISGATMAGVSTIIDGLKEELRDIIASDLTDENIQIAEALRIAGTSVDRMLSVAKVKSGKGHWLSLAMKGIDGPGEADDQMKSEDFTPIWLRGKSRKK